MAANNIDHFRYQNNGCEKKNQEISRMGFTSQLFKFETKINCGSSKYIAN